MALPAGSRLWLRGNYLSTDLNVCTDLAGTVAAVNDGDRVMFWRDMSGNGNHVTQDGSINVSCKPTYQAPNALTGRSRPGVRFEAVDGILSGNHQFMNLAAGMSTDRQACTLLVVAQTHFQAGGLSSQCIIAPGAAGLHGTLWWTPPTTPPNYGRAQIASPVTEVLGRTHFGCQNAVIGYRLSASEARVFRNENSFISPNVLTAGSSTGGMLMRFTAGTPWHCWGTIYELLMYPSALSDSVLNAAIQELMANHGIPTSFLNIVCDGDSIMAGQNVSANNVFCTKNQNVSNFMANAIPEAEISNVAVSGQKISDLDANFAGRVAFRYDQSKKLNIYATIVGTNNTSGFDATPAVTIAALKALCLKAKGAGFAVLVATQIPRNDAFGTDRNTYNALLRTSYTEFADGLVDLAADPFLSDFTNTTYFNGDKIHLTAAGNGVAASKFTAEVARLVELKTRQRLRARP